MPRTPDVSPDEVRGVIARVKKAILLQAVVDLDLDFAYHRAHEQEQVASAAAVYAERGSVRSAATLGESLALAGVGPGSRAADAGWAVLVAADETDPAAEIAPGPTPSSLNLSAPPAPAAPRRAKGRPARTDI